MVTERAASRIAPLAVRSVTATQAGAAGRGHFVRSALRRRMAGQQNLEEYVTFWFSPFTISMKSKRPQSAVKELRWASTW